MMLDVAGGVIIAAAICALFAWGVFGVIEDSELRTGLTQSGGWVCIAISTGAAIAIVLF